MKSIFTMSAEERMKQQKKGTKRMDRMVAKNIKAAKKKIKKAVAGKVLKTTAFVAIAAGAGVIAAKGKKAVAEKLSLILKEAALKIKEKNAVSESEKQEEKTTETIKPDPVVVTAEAVIKVAEEIPGASENG